MNSAAYSQVDASRSADDKALQHASTRNLVGVVFWMPPAAFNLLYCAMLAPAEFRNAAPGDAVAEEQKRPDAARPEDTDDTNPWGRRRRHSPGHSGHGPSSRHRGAATPQRKEENPDGWSESLAPLIYLPIHHYTSLLPLRPALSHQLSPLAESQLMAIQSRLRELEDAHSTTPRPFPLIP